MAEHNQTGKRGEDIAEAFLKGKGYTIIERNWHSSHKELDIIAEHEGWLVIVEVKTRSGDSLILPEDAVDRKKIRRTVSAAHHYVCMHDINKPVRFDVIAIVFENGITKIEHFEDAFLAMNA
jgi:putative endonuclease